MLVDCSRLDKRRIEHAYENITLAAVFILFFKINDTLLTSFRELTRKLRSKRRGARIVQATQRTILYTSYMALDTLLLAFGSGVCNGTFPVFIKTKPVLAAKIHPIVFQFYKSLWVCLFGCVCAIVRLARGLPLEFTVWAALSAAAWIPSGVFTIIAVPHSEPSTDDLGVSDGVFKLRRWRPLRSRKVLSTLTSADLSALGSTAS